MDNIKTLEIKCTSCEKWFPSPIGISNLETFDSTIIVGNKVSCPHCNNLVDCNKENMRVRGTNGGFQGIDTV